MALCHYIIVRRDLPLGVLAAMITHAAGESAALYSDPEDGRFRHAIAVVLEVKTEEDLLEANEYLFSNNIQRVLVKESGGPYDGQYMAIGLVPLERNERVRGLLDSFQTLKTCLDNERSHA
jgi:peptidyl-tRNA hydrolase